MRECAVEMVAPHVLHRRSVRRSRSTPQNLCPEGSFQSSVLCANSVPTQPNGVDQGNTAQKKELT